MKVLLAAAALLGASVATPIAPAQAWEPFPFCEATRLYVVYEASEGFLLYGAARRNDSIKTTISCTIRRFGTTVVASSSATLPGPASATAKSVTTPYGGMEVCTSARYETLAGQTVISPLQCKRIPAP